MKRYIFYKTPYFSFVALFCALVLIGCENQTHIKSPSKKTVADSVSLWIEQSKNRKLKFEAQEMLLQKAFDYTKQLKSEKTQSANYSRLAYETEFLNSDTLFKESKCQSHQFGNKIKGYF